MRVKLDRRAFKETKWQQLALRFVFGGLATAAAGIIAKKFGPGVGGLFLAFPAIFPAGATLIEKHEKERKERVGMHGTIRARKAVAVDAAGAAIGSVGLLAFAWMVYRFVDSGHPYIVVMVATATWMAVSLLLWIVRKRM
jgi:Protein of unknown function (DUF3147)